MPRASSAAELARGSKPPAIRRRRRHFLAGLLLTLTAGSTVIPWYLSHRATYWEGTSTVRVASTARRVISRLSGDPIARPAATELATVLATAEEIERDLRTRRNRSISADLRQSAWSRVEEASAAALNRYRLQRSGDRERWNEIETTSDSLLRSASGATPFSAPPSREYSLALDTASQQLDVARRLASGGRYREATARAERALEDLRTADEARSHFLKRFVEPENQQRWRSWAEAASIEAGNSGRSWVLVDKLRHCMFVFCLDRGVEVFEIELGAHGLVRKLHAGDRATPEGRYRIVAKKSGDQTRYYKALLLDYPNAEDLERWQRARRSGTLPTEVGVGGLIEIHGGGGRGVDWTDGCIAMTDSDMDLLFRVSEVGTEVVIVGSFTSSGWGRSAIPAGPVGPR